MPFVLDPSVVMGWCFEDEATPYAARVLAMLRDDEAVVPVVWPLEVANALCMGERRRRIDLATAERFSQVIQTFSIRIDNLGLPRAFGTVLNLARAQGLTAYDASYLELAIREGIPLATQDDRMREAARRTGVPLVP